MHPLCPGPAARQKAHKASSTHTHASDPSHPTTDPHPRAARAYCYFLLSRFTSSLSSSLRAPFAHSTRARGVTELLPRKVSNMPRERAQDLQPGSGTAFKGLLWGRAQSRGMERAQVGCAEDWLPCGALARPTTPTMHALDAGLRLHASIVPEAVLWGGYQHVELIRPHSPEQRHLGVV